MVNPALLDSAIKLRSPEALVYEPRGDSLKLVAVEYVVDRKAWHDAGNSKAPKLFGRQFGLITTNPFGLKPFYALHAWIWKKNPTGWLQPWNPSVSCPVVGARLRRTLADKGEGPGRSTAARAWPVADRRASA